MDMGGETSFEIITPQYEGSLFAVAACSSLGRPRCKNRETEVCEGNDVLQRISCFMAMYWRETCYRTKVSVKRYVLTYRCIQSSGLFNALYTSPPADHSNTISTSL